MAVSTVVYSSSSSPLYTKVANFSFTTSPLPLSTHFISNPFKPLKPFKLTTQFPTSLPLPFLPSSHRAFFSAFDSFEASSDEDVASQDDPPAEAQEFDHEGEVEEVKPDESNEETKLYVGNFPYSMTSSQLTEVFEEAGRVVNVEIIYDRVTDRSRGFGFVTMGSFDEAKEAIRMFNGSQVGGRTVRVNFPEVPKGGEREVMGPKIRNSYKGFIDSPHKIYAGNLGWGLTSQGLRDAFADQPGVLSAKVIYERDTGRSRGFGFVSFESAEDAEAALNAMNGLEVEGRPLRLNLASERARPLAIERTTENNTESSASSELLSSISG